MLPPILPFGRVLLLACALAAPVSGQIVINQADTPYTQNFNTLPASGTGSPAQVEWNNNSTLAGWYLHAGNNLNADVSAIRVTAGSTTSRSQTSYGTGTNTDRALGSQGGSVHDLSASSTAGSIAENSVFGTISVAFSNNTGAALPGFSFSYTGEQWVRSSNTTPSSRDTLTVQWAFATSATAAPTSLTWNTFSAQEQNANGVNFQGPQRGTSSTALDGNASANRRTNLGATVSGIVWEPGQVIFIRWVDINDSGTDGGLAVDDFSFTATGGSVNFEPTVALTAPVAGSIFNAPASITLTATAADSDGSIAKVEFFNGSTKFGEVTSSPFEFTWTNVAPGTYTLSAKATDDGGATATSSTVTIYVNNSDGSFTYTQDFNGLGTSAGAVLGSAATGTAGWSFHGSLGGARETWDDSTGILTTGNPNAGTTGTVNNTLTLNSNAASATATSNTAGFNFSLSGSTSDRALGTSPTSGAGVAMQLTLTNTSAHAVSAIRVGYDIRRFTAPAIENQLPGYWLFYSLDNGSTWHNVNEFNPVLSGGNVNVPNTAGVTTVPLSTIALNGVWASGSQARFRWVDDNAFETSPDQIIGLDNLTLTTQGVNFPPTVTLSAPMQGETFVVPATINLAATAADGDGSIVRVEFLANGVKIGEDDTAPYEFAWSSAISGTHSLTARAVDDGDAFTVSLPVSITVTNPNNTPPSVAITSPVDGARLPASIVSLTAAVADTDGIVTKVEFFANAVKIGEVSSAPFTFAWSNPPVGVHALTALATDNDGGINTSAPVSIETIPFVLTRTLAKGSVWKYLDDGSDQGTAWSQPAFDDSAWASGPGKLGYEDSPVTVLRQGPDGMTSTVKFITYYFRREFTVPDASKVSSMLVNVLRDDGVVIYVNGVEAGRSNMPEGPVDYLTNSATTVSGADETTYYPVALDPSLLVNGANVIAVELHQRDNASSDLGFDLELVTSVVDGNQAPSVALTSPANNSFHAAGGNVTLTASADDTDGGISKVEFYNGATKLGESTSAPYSLTWTNVSAGSYSLTALALDNEGGYTVSTPVSITVSPPPGIVAGPWSGNLTHSSASISVAMDGSGITTRAVLSTSADLSNPFYSTTAVSASSSGNSVRLEVTGLQPLTTYHYAIEGNGALLTSGDLKGKFTTLPTPGPASFRFAFGSCGSYSNTSQFVYESIVNDNPLFFMHMGDMNYQDINSTNPANYRTVYNAQITTGQLRRVCRAMGMTYIWDDHDYAGNDSNKNNTGRTATRQVYRERFPHYPLPAENLPVGNPQGADSAIYQTFTVGRVKYILTDLRSERDPISQTENSSKSHMGAVQKQWFKDQLIAARDAETPLIVWNSSVPFISTSTSGDDWGRFQTERTEILNFIKTERIQNICVISGDMHALALDDGTGTNSYVSGVRIPVFHGAALAQSGSSKGGPYRVGGSTITVSQGLGRYGIMDIADTGTSLTATFRGRIASGSGSTLTSTSDWAFLTGQTQYVFNTEPVRPRKALNAAASAVIGKIQLTWSDDSGVESGYRVERKPSTGGTWTALETTAANATSYDDTSAQPGVSYDYRVIAVNSTVEADPSITASATALNNNARLASIGLSDGALTPAFDADTLAYEVTVEFGTEELLVTPITLDANASVTVNGGPTSTAVTLALGTNTIALLVTAQDTTTQTYTLSVRRRSDDLTAPVLKLTSPTTSTKVNVSGVLTGDLVVKGTADDDRAVESVTVSVNEGAFMPLSLTVGRGNQRTFSATLPEVLDRPGANSVVIRTTDSNGNITELTRAVTLIIKGALTVHVVGPAVTDGLISGTSTLPKFEVGKTYMLTAKPFDAAKPDDSSYSFSEWQYDGQTSRALRLSFTMTTGLIQNPVITATYITNPFLTAKVGRFGGLIQPKTGITPGNDNHGFTSLTVTTKGSFSGTMHYDGYKHSVRGVFDNHGAATVVIPRAATLGLADLTAVLSLDLKGGTDRITGEMSGSEISAARAAHSASAPVASEWLNATVRGYQTLVLRTPSIGSPAGLGSGSLIIKPDGTVTTMLMLSDAAGKSVSAYATVLDKDLGFPLFAGLHLVKETTLAGKSVNRHLGAITGNITLDAAPTDADGTGTLVWFRPALTGVQHYPAGWPAGITTHFASARYHAAATSPVLSGLGPVDTTVGNARFSLTEGLLSVPFLRSFNIQPLTGKAALLPQKPADKSWQISITKSTGLFKGSFNHESGGRPAFQGALYQKGAAPSGHGSFLSPIPPVVDGTGEGGAVRIELP